MNRMPPRPNFLFIGPDKCGSSWLFETLRQHPACFVPVAKDIYFFDRYYTRGWPWYARHFAGAPAGSIAVGELSHDYLFSPLAAARVAADLPDVKLLTILREPVDRSFSHYLYMVRSGRTRLPFEAALDRFPELLGNSEYGRHLKPWFALFERDRIGVFRFDALQRAPRELGEAVLAFLGLPPERAIDFDRHVRPAAAPRSHLAARLGRQAAGCVRALGFPNLVGLAKNGGRLQWLYRPYAAAERPRVDPALRTRLERHFAPDHERLRALLGDATPVWPWGLSA